MRPESVQKHIAPILFRHKIINFFSAAISSGCAKNFYLGVIAQGVWALGVPNGVQGRSPGRGLVPQKLKQFADIV